MPPEVRRLASAFLTDPIEVQAAPPATAAERIADHLTLVAPRSKFKVLRRLIDTQNVDKALIFCNRKREVASLRRQLERAGMNVGDIHGDLDQAQRNQALDAFKKGSIDFLVATDVAARGLDIAMLPCVINYDVPTHAEDYIHRIGRTGRAGQEGRAFTLALPEDQRFIDAINNLTGKVIPKLELPDVKPATAAAPVARATPVAPATPAAPAAPTERPRRRAAAAEAGSSDAPRSRRRAAPRARVQTESEPASRPAAAEPNRRGSGRHEKPVVGMGDHVPLFMQRPVPGMSSARKADED
jgi:superfamily II DNA/RNA helicase